MLAVGLASKSHRSLVLRAIITRAVNAKYRVSALVPARTCSICSSCGIERRRPVQTASVLGLQHPARQLYISSGSDPAIDELHAISEIFHDYHIVVVTHGMAEDRAVSGADEPRPVVMCGPSGCGKSTLLKQLMQEYPDIFGFSVSHTTRKPRHGEVDGRDYHFVSGQAMKDMITGHDFIEHATYSGNTYGTSKQAVRDVVHSGRICILDIDVQGAKQLKEIPDINPLYVFITPPSRDELEARLRGRGTETEASVSRRLEAADQELAYSRQAGAFDVLITNDQFDIAYEKLRTAVYDDIQKVVHLQKLSVEPSGESQ